MKVLLHACCGPCSCYPVPRLRKEGLDVHGYFFNPNIHPYTEYLRRLETMKQYAEMVYLPVIYDDYPFEDYFRKVVYREGERCHNCYAMRLQRTAATARRLGFDAFTTTLLYSKFQKHDAIREIAGKLAGEYNIDFYYLDLREGWKEGIKISREMELFRQQYCGCVYSEWERYKGGKANAKG
jgi:predicted adenine nucleotide alpha hydrolase (AANH) superfamily ATPase